MTLKRSREDFDRRDMGTVATANYLMLLSDIGRTTSADRIYECKTCSRKFPSFQALGGHRTSHKKPKLIAGEFLAAVKSKTHECSICGVEFALGQALGGHMRRHRAVIENSDVVTKRCNSSKRVLCLDLSLTPYEIDLRLKL